MNDAERVDAVLDGVLPRGQLIEPLPAAMRYAVLGGGKRIRPRLVYAAGRLAGASIESLDPAAAAVELIHAYSLIHDDLPAMDDDDLRRGSPTVHRRFDEATATLAGDALQTLAFEAIANAEVDDGTARAWLRLLAKAAGHDGMVGGQVLDLAGESRALDQAELEALHRRKTGALIHAAVMMGGVAGRLDADELASLGRFGADIGLAFQVHDDVLDATTATEVLGKPQGSDVRQGKSTYVSLLGIENARQHARAVYQGACSHLAAFGSRADALLAIAEDIVRREN